MILLIDAGNSRVKWAWFDGTDLESGDSFATDLSQAASLLDAHWANFPVPGSVLLSNVAGPYWERTILNWVAARWSVGVMVVRSEATAHGIINAYAKPALLGADRWVGMIGAKAMFGLPCCLVDCGTAVTVDLVDRQGRHCGGWIVPGLSLSREALVRRAPGLACHDVSAPVGWGLDTGMCIAAGTVAMVQGLVERAMLHARTTLGEEPLLILTGGDAVLIAAGLSVPHRVERDLVLRGLAQYARTTPGQPSCADRS